MIHQDKYYKNIGKYIKKDKKDSEPKLKNYAPQVEERADLV